MIARIFTVIIFMFIVGILFISMSNHQNMTVIVPGNKTKQPLEIVLGKFQDSDCGMVIEDLTYASQVVSKAGSTWFFHDHGGMANWLKDDKFRIEAVVWVMSKDSNKWIDGKKAWYSRTEQTPMLYGFGAYENKQDGMVDFETMVLFMKRGENLTNPQIKNQLLGNR